MFFTQYEFAVFLQFLQSDNNNYGVILNLNEYGVYAVLTHGRCSLQSNINKAIRIQYESTECAVLHSESKYFEVV